MTPPAVFRRSLLPVALAFLTLSLTSATAHAGNWPRFRGEDGAGVSPLKGLPTTWSPGDYAWTIELPGTGHSAPIVWEKTVFVTSAEEDGAIRHLFCLDGDTGEILWTRTTGGNRSRKHQKSSWASSTPCTDGQRVYVAFADQENYTLTAYDFAGELVWRRNLGNYENQHGIGTSPILFDDMVILANDQDGPSSIIAFEASTGTTRWSVLRRSREVSYATPIVIEPEHDKPQLICVSGATGISSLDPYTGRQNWASGAFPLRTVASPVYADGLLVASCGQGGRFGVLMLAVDPTGNGTGSGMQVRYERKRELPYVPTPISYGDHLYLWQDNGIVSCVETATGETMWSKRIGGNYSGSPICVDGKLYCPSEDGEMVVLDAAPEYKLHGRSSLGDPCHSTPAAGNGRLYVRTFHRLACLEAVE